MPFSKTSQPPRLGTLTDRSAAAKLRYRNRQVAAVGGDVIAPEDALRTSPLVRRRAQSHRLGASAPLLQHGTVPALKSKMHKGGLQMWFQSVAAPNCCWARMSSL